jgi:hypothetical protein
LYAGCRRERAKRGPYFGYIKAVITALAPVCGWGFAYSLAPAQQRVGDGVMEGSMGMDVLGARSSVMGLERRDSSSLEIDLVSVEEIKEKPLDRKSVV